ncbi:hypothetical protein EVAR_5614_1 [Eumeta japonica]|uniref:Uncharacterized protein n=1 Tax=Eumeta variegata TaxID=151549 RepID=A0A4C1T7A0_EUMVA|nr:hypothetical protein EVAR_5614_1 [Eumeta japonica]
MIKYYKLIRRIFVVGSRPSRDHVRAVHTNTVITSKQCSEVRAQPRPRFLRVSRHTRGCQSDIIDTLIAITGKKTFWDGLSIDELRRSGKGPQTAIGYKVTGINKTDLSCELRRYFVKREFNVYSVVIQAVYSVCEI